MEQRLRKLAGGALVCRALARTLSRLPLRRRLTIAVLTVTSMDADQS